MTELAFTAAAFAPLYRLNLTTATPVARGARIARSPGPQRIRQTA